MCGAQSTQRIKAIPQEIIFLNSGATENSNPKANTPSSARPTESYTLSTIPPLYQPPITCPRERTRPSSDGHPLLPGLVSTSSASPTASQPNPPDRPRHRLAKRTKESVSSGSLSLFSRPLRSALFPYRCAAVLILYESVGD